MHKDSEERKVRELLEKAYQIRGSKPEESIKLSRQALALSHQLQDEQLIADSLNRLSLFLMITGSYTESAQCAEEAIKYYKKIGDEKGIADAKYSLGGIHYKTNNHHLGMMQLLDCLSIYQKHKDYHNQARVHKSLGSIYEYFDDDKRAIVAYERTIEAARIAEDLNLESNALNPLSGIFLNQGKIKEATEMIEKSLAIKKQTGDTRGYAFALYGRGKIYIKTGEYEKAESDLFESLATHKRVGDLVGKAVCYVKLGTLYYESGNYQKAIDILTEGIEFGSERNVQLLKFKGSHLMYKTYKKLGDIDNALRHLEFYLSEKDQAFSGHTKKIIENYERIVSIETQEKETKLQLEKAEILKKKDIAEEASRVKQDFLSTMSHEIRTPLNAIITIASLLNERSNPQEKELIDSLRFSSNNLLLLINDILDFSKLEAGKYELDPHPGDLRLLLQNIKNTYSSLAREKGLRVNLQVDPKISPAYLLDETKISQILGNLISNAIKFTEMGSVTIMVEKQEHLGSEETIHFAVADTGQGIEEEYISTIFESFSQSKSITKRKVGGTGLGLAIVKKLVNLHGSDIFLESKKGVGTTFRFRINLKPTQIAEQAPKARSNELNEKLILLAEDNLVNAMVAKKLLSNWGIQTDHAKNGLEAVEMVGQKIYDYILLDIHMPEMDGFEAVKIIRESDNLNISTPIFALTADITVKNKEKYSTYFNDFLLKPIERDKLYGTLKQYGKIKI